MLAYILCASKTRPCRLDIFEQQHNNNKKVSFVFLFSTSTYCLNYTLAMSVPSADLYKTLILGANTPFVIKSLNLSWPCMQTTLEQWCDQFNNDSVSFETGKLFNSQLPQWERCRQPMLLKLSEFLKQYHESSNTETWAAYSYKHLKYLPKTCREGVSFAPLGFEDHEDISFWLGSKGAHTSCHYDTYGCNIVVQVYGRYFII